MFFSADVSIDSPFIEMADCKPYGDRPNQVRRTIAPELSKTPLLLVNKACTKFLYSNLNIVFKDGFQSICAPRQDKDKLLFLTAILSSPLTQYLLFHTTANIGIERDIARLEEILDLPFPLPEDMHDPKRSKSILKSCARRLRRLREELNKPKNLLKRAILLQDAQDELYKLICEYFQICEWESDLIKDTVEIFRPSSTPGSLESESLLTASPSQPAHRQEYVETLVRTFRGWTRTKRHLCAEGSIATKIGVALITFSVGDRAKKYVETVLEDRVMQALDNIRKATAQDGVMFHRLRGFALYEPDRVHILKPLSRRHWTRTAALNDADEILTRMMEENGWRD